MTTDAKLAVFGVTLLHNALNLCTHKFVIVLTIILQDALDKFEAFTESLILDI